MRARVSGGNPPRFLVTTEQLSGERVRLSRDETHHLRVRRLGAGTDVTLFDGRGGSARAVVERMDPHAAELCIGERFLLRTAESALSITLLQALLKGERFDWVVEKATELGVTCIQPVSTSRSLGRPADSRRARWQQIAVSAAKQSGRSVVPEIAPPVPLEQALASPPELGLLIWEGAPPEASLAGRAAVAPRQVSLLVGPEGGFAADETEDAVRAGFRPVTLGPRVLRADTAAIVAVALCQTEWGDLAGRTAGE